MHNSALKPLKYSVDTKIECPDCRELIHVSYRGPAGLVEHQGKSKCLATQKKKSKDEKQKNQPTLLRFGLLANSQASKSIQSKVILPPMLAPVPHTLRSISGDLSQPPMQSTHSDPPSSSTPIHLSPASPRTHPESDALFQAMKVGEIGEEIDEIAPPPLLHSLGLRLNPIDVDKAPLPSPVTARSRKNYITMHTPTSTRLPTCQGIQFDFASGQDPCMHYPFALHSSLALPWGFEVIDQHMTLRSNACETYRSGNLSVDSFICSSCQALDNSQVLRGIRDRLVTGVHENTSWHYLSMHSLHELLQRKSNQLDSLRIDKLTQARKLTSRIQNLDEHKKFIVALGGDRSVQRVGALVAIAVKQRMGIKGIVERFWKAAKGIYHPKGYTDEEKMKSLLFYRLGGVRVADIAHRTLQLPATSTIRSYKLSSMLKASPLAPTSEEVEYNLGETFCELASLLDDGSTPDYILMIDELKIEERPRLDAPAGKVLGICREHGNKVALSIDSYQDLEQLATAVDKNEVHIASECTVAAIGLLTPDKRLYAARPIMMSGTCKREKSIEHSKLISTVIQSCKLLAPKLGLGRLVSLSSDGEARRGASFSQLTLVKPIQPTSALFPLLSGLQLFNTLVGEDDLTGDKDYKHIFKRLRNLLLGSLGTFINGVHITPAVLRLHLGDCGTPKTRIDYMLCPDDKQDVTLAVQLLQSIVNMPPPDCSTKPSYARSRHALNLLGTLVDLIVKPYVDISLTLSNQLEKLSAAAHLTLWLHTRSTKTTRFLPLQLYSDIMIMIKNAYICFAKAKVKDPKGSFWLTLLGTDRLEAAFGIVRTMVGNDANADALQLASRLANATTCANILAEHPEWDHTPRRLKLQSVDSSTNAAARVDHINPGVWKGNVDVEQVHPLTCWRKGRQSLGILLPTAIASVVEEELANLSRNNLVDILSPFGELVLNRLSDPSSVGTEPDDIDYAGDSIDGSLLPMPVDPSHLDLEDLAGAENAEQTPGAPSPYLRLESGESVHKARAISQIFFNSKRNSTDRLSRVAGLSKYAISTKKTDICAIIDHDSALGEPALHVNDPAAALLCCGMHIFLAIVQVNRLQYDGVSVLDMTTARLGEKVADATVQILCLALCAALPLAKDVSPQVDWQWTQRYGSVLKIPGRFMQPINPAILASETGDATYAFSTEDLLGITALLAGCLSSQDLIELPQVAQSEQFPYLYHGKACFLYEKEVDTRDPTGHRDHNACPACVMPTVPLCRSKPPQVLEHMGAHILYDTAVDRATEPCGFCLRPSATCPIFLSCSKGKDATPKIDLTKSTACPYATKFSYKAASQSKPASPCSNVPLVCDLCSQASPAVWRYNFEAHLLANHPLADPDSYTNQYQLLASEVAAMKIVWDRRQVAPRAPKGKGTGHELAISEAHSSRMVLRTIDLPMNGEQLVANETEPSEHQDGSTNEDQVTSDEHDMQLDEGPDPQLAAASLFTTSVVSTRSGRARKQRPILDEITACYPCGTKVTTDEIQAGRLPGAELRVMMCSNKQCETKWFHLDCYNFSYVPKDWDCGEHGSGRPTTNKRRRYD